MSNAYTIEQHAERIAAGLRSSATCTALIGDNENGSVLFEKVRQHIPVVGVISVTGRTLHLGVVTEDVSRFGHNDRINLATHMAHVRKVVGHSPERVFK